VHFSAKQCKTVHLLLQKTDRDQRICTYKFHYLPENSPAGAIQGYHNPARTMHKKIER